MARYPSIREGGAGAAPGEGGGRPRGPATAGRAPCKAAAHHFGSSDSNRCQCLLSPSRRRSQATRAAGTRRAPPLSRKLCGHDVETGTEEG